MLILTRRVGESLRIGDEIAVTVLRVKGSHVRVGIDAPKALQILREEISTRKAGDRRGSVDGNR